LIAFTGFGATANISKVVICVVICDEQVAYIRSANFTGAGLGGRTLERGVVIRGEGVSSIGNLLDLFSERDETPR